MTPKFQADADLHFEIVAGVLRREPAVDFQSAQEAFEERLGDEDARRGSSPGILLLPQSVPLGQAIDEIILIWAASESQEWRDRISRLPL